ncbi:hypothetical protein BD289DRAFT_439566 [Coniella lustricola]|uniref:Uncharacterized protein n=1 Tax=Coniella lustricola TaxID=2025994 RepID=A0A2T3A1L4_9PEZI|nr:hypothetical protein BD289DRAFT_439566 [Coniella lustricola]
MSASPDSPNTFKKPGPAPSPSPYTGAIALDPGKNSGPLNDAICAPVLICHSAPWSKTPSPSPGLRRPIHVPMLSRKANKNNNATSPLPSPSTENSNLIAKLRGSLPTSSTSSSNKPDDAGAGAHADANDANDTDTDTATGKRDTVPTPRSLYVGRPHFEVVRNLVEKLNIHARECVEQQHLQQNPSTISSDASHTATPPTHHHNPPPHKHHRRTPHGWFLTALRTTHSSVTDAPLLHPILLSLFGSSTPSQIRLPSSAARAAAYAEAHEGVRQYVRVTRDFIHYQHTGVRVGLLALSGKQEDEVVQREYDPGANVRGGKGAVAVEEDGAERGHGGDDEVSAEWRAYWQVHVVPDEDIVLE